MIQHHVISFLESLEICINHTPNMQTRALLKKEINEDAPSAAVVDGSAVSFVAGVKGQVRTDILNSLLLAQLAANKVADRFTDTINWYKKYTEVLGKVGWVIQDFNFQNQGSSSVSVDVNSVVVSLLGTMVASQGITIVSHVLKSLQDPASGGALTFNVNSSYKNNSNFQVGHVTQTDDNIVSVSTAAIEVHASTHSSGWWLWKVNTSSADITAASQSMTFNLDLYSQVREVVRKKLGASAEEYIQDLDI